MSLYLPNEIVNIILSYVERPNHVKIINNLIEDCYEEDFDPYWAELWEDMYCFKYSFYEWYFLYRYQFQLGGIKKGIKHFYKYKHTHNVLLIGSDRLYN